MYLKKINYSPAIYKDYPGLMRLSMLKFFLTLLTVCFFSYFWELKQYKRLWILT